MKAILLNSGGIDSRITAALLKEQGYELHSLFVTCEPQSLKGQLKPAKKTADLYCVSHKVFDFPEDLSTEFYTHHHGIPYKALLVNIIGASYGSKHDIRLIASGFRCDVAEINLVERLKKYVFGAMGANRKNVDFITPLWEFETYKQVIEKYAYLNVPLKDTYSCSFYPMCGKCNRCQKRKEVGL